jgi:hypothetical protein
VFRINFNNKTAWLLSLIGVVCLVILVVLLFNFSNNETKNCTTVNISEYFMPNVCGYDEYGSIAPTIDYNKMIDEVCNDSKAALKAKSLVKTYQPISIECSLSHDLKNGDVVNVTFTRNDDAAKAFEEILGIKLDGNDLSYTISGLASTQDYDPFLDLFIDTKKTASGKGDLDCSIHYTTSAGEIVLPVKHNGNNGTIKNGDVLMLELDENVDMNAFTRDTGLKITKTTSEHTVTYLRNYAIDDVLFEKLTTYDKNRLNRIIEEWVISGINDANGMGGREYELSGYIFYTNADSKSIDFNTKEPEGMLVAIYKITDNFIDDGYYVFIGLKDVFSYDYNGVYVGNGENLPYSFVYYEKETVRYDKMFGWGEGFEDMGFLYNKIAYAGKKNIAETFEYLEKTYGADYQYRFVSEDLKNIAPER